MDSDAVALFLLRNRYPAHRESRNLKYFNNGNLESYSHAQIRQRSGLILSRYER